MVMTRSYDVVLLGATGFTGKIAVEYLNERYGGSDVKFAVTARSERKLDALKPLLSKSPNAAAELCDVTDHKTLDSLISRSACVLNFAGTPFIDKALPVVESCAKHGTHYVDITGELPLHRASYDRFNEAAKSSGALILHQCGFDSVPADLTSYLAAKTMRERHGCGCAEIRAFAGDSYGGFSGGTIATIISLIKAGNDLPGQKEVNQRGAYALDPDGASGGPDKSLDGRGSLGVKYDSLAGKFTIPFIMAPTNAPLVRKSAALLRYGNNCRVSEALACNSRLGAWATLAVIAVGIVLVALPPTRWLLLKTGALPEPGDGPSKEVQNSGFFHEYAVAVGSGPGAPITKAHMRSGNAGDPGYKATSRMSVEAALCAALDRDKCASKQGGVLTPAAALGDAYIERLRASGMELTVDA